MPRHNFFLLIKSSLGQFQLHKSAEEKDRLFFDWMVMDAPVRIDSVQLMAQINRDSNQKGEPITKAFAPEIKTARTKWENFQPYEKGRIIIRKNSLVKDYLLLRNIKNIDPVYPTAILTDKENNTPHSPQFI